MRVAASRVNKTAAATSPHIHWPPGNLVIACILLVTANTALLIAALQTTHVVMLRCRRFSEYKQVISFLREFFYAEERVRWSRGQNLASLFVC